ncbi:hypothetical protein L873DRAFT_1611535, partial [Choiromyces venosus 120613-1]
FGYFFLMNHESFLALLSIVHEDPIFANNSCNPQGPIEIQLATALAVEESSGFPGCIGFLDGTDIVLRYGPSYHGETYFNRKKQYALNVQAICDSKRRFTYIAGGYPASVGDATVFSCTTFFKQPNLFFSHPDEYILADKAY